MYRDFLTAMDLRTWKPFEQLWIATFLLIGTGVTVATKDSLSNYLILLTGILCVILAAKGSIWNYAFGLVNSFGYGYVAMTNGLYGEMGLNFGFFAPTAIVGFLMWKGHLSDTTVRMRGLKTLHQVLVAATCLLATLALGRFLSGLEGQNSPYIDSTTNILSIAATFLMMWRYKEQWILYIVLNVVTIAMWSLRLEAGSTDALLMIVMWSAYLVNAVYGYLNWREGALEQTRGAVGA